MARGYRSTELRGNLSRMTGDAIAFSVMIGAGETYLAAFVLALGMGEITAGLIASIPMLTGAVLQLVTPAAVRALRSHKRWVVTCAIVQASTFVPLVVAALVGTIPEAAVFLIASVYWGAGMATGPAWNTWAGTLVPPRIRAHYFARRSRAAHVAVLGGILFSGLALQIGQSMDRTLLVFAMMFLVSGACRTLSAIFLAGQTEPEPPDQDHREVPWRELVFRFRHSHDGRLLLFMLAFQTAVQLSGPYFTPYMLGRLQLSYGNYLLLIATSYTARVLVLPVLGHVVNQLGARRVMWVSAVGIIPMSSLWLVSDSVIYLFFVQLMAGTVWAAYELTTFLLFFETIPVVERTSVLTTFNLGNAVAMVLGATIGGWMLKHMGSDHDAYLTIFAASGVLRVMTMPLLIRAMRVIPAEVVIAPPEAGPVPTRVLAVRTDLGSIERPILPGLPEVVTKPASSEQRDGAAR